MTFQWTRGLKSKELRVVCIDKTSSLKEKLEENRLILIHTKIWRSSQQTCFKVQWNMSPAIIYAIFNRPEIDYELRNFSQFSMLHVKRLHNGEVSILCQGLKTWETVLKEIEELTSPNVLKNSIKKGNPTNCLCRFCEYCV